MDRELITYISTYGNKCINAGNGIPLEVGAAGRSAFLYATRDDAGDNISEDNEYYGDLTALYWIWKNGELDSHDYIEFRHSIYINTHSFPRLEANVCRNRWFTKKLIILVKALGFRNNNPVTGRIAAA